MRQGGVTGRNTSEDGRTHASSSCGETPSKFGSVSGRTPSRCGTRENIAAAIGRTHSIPSRGHGTTEAESSIWRSGCEFAGTQPGICSTAVQIGETRDAAKHKELASQLSSRHAAEVSALNEQLMLEADNMRATYEKESEKESALPSRRKWNSPDIKESLESAVENEEVIVVLSKCGKLTKREKQLLLEDT